MSVNFIPDLNEIGGLSALLGRATNNGEFLISERELDLWQLRAFAKLAGGAYSAAVDALTQNGTLAPSPQQLKMLTTAAMCIMADRVDGIFWTPTIIAKDKMTVIASPGQLCFYVRSADTAWFTVNLSFNIPDTSEEDTIYVTMPSGLITTAGDPGVGTTFMPSLVLQDTSTFEAQVSADDSTNTLLKLVVSGETFTSTAAVIKIGAQLLTKVKDV